MAGIVHSHHQVETQLIYYAFFILSSLISAFDKIFSGYNQLYFIAIHPYFLPSLENENYIVILLRHTLI